MTVPGYGLASIHQESAFSSDPYTSGHRISKTHRPFWGIAPLIAKDSSILAN